MRTPSTRPHPSETIGPRACARVLMGAGLAFGLLGVLGLVCAAAAGSPNDGDSRQLRVEVEPTPLAAQPALADAQRRNLGSSAYVGQADRGTRLRWWYGRYGREGVEIGTGVDWPSLAQGTPGRPALGLRAGVSRSTSVVYEVSPAARPWDPNLREPADAAQSRLALEFKPNAASSHLAGGLLRVQLSNQSTLQLRPRGGGLTVMYRERF